MIRCRHSALFMLLPLICLTGAAAAQSGGAANQGRAPVPAAGTWAAGVDAGFSNPIGDEDLDTDPLLSGYGEYFFTQHLSLRGTLLLMSFDGPSVPPPFPSGGSIDVIAVLGNVVYQWDGRTVLPYVTAGVGLYDYDEDFGDDDLEVGLNFGGGANFFLSRRFAIKLEGTFHGTSASEPDAFFNATVGARWVF